MIRKPLCELRMGVCTARVWRDVMCAMAWLSGGACIGGCLHGCATPVAHASQQDNADQAATDGLTCIRYTVDADAPRLEAVAAAFASRIFPSTAERATLAREGLQAAIIPAVELPAIRRRLGSVSEVTQMIIGQSPTWVDIAHRTLNADSLLTVNGQFQRGENGWLQLSVRTFVTPLAQSSCVQVEVVMHLNTTTAPRAGLPGDAPAGVVIATASINCCLQHDEALLILPLPTASPGKGPASQSDLPPTCGVYVLGEPANPTSNAHRGYSIAIALIAKVPESIRQISTERVDMQALMPDTLPQQAPAESP